MTAREVLDGIKQQLAATNLQRIDLDEPGVRYAPTVAPMESLLDTRAGMALANAAWQEGASAAIRYCNDDDAVTKPVSPYSAPLLKMIKSGAAAAPVDVARLTRAVEAVLNLHAPRTEGSDEPYCRHCHQAPYGHAPYPCPTVAAIENAVGEVS